MDAEARERKRVWDRLVLRRKLGFKFLDEKLPDWRLNLDEDRLDMGNHRRCVLGQQPGGWRRNIAFLAESTDDQETARLAQRLGLEPKPEDFVAGQDPYDALTRTWRGALRGEMARKRSG